MTDINKIIKELNDPIDISPNQSFVEWMKTSYFNQSPCHGIRKGIDLYEYQVKICEQFESGNSCVITARQMGITTLAAGFAYWNCITNPNYLVYGIKSRPYMNQIIDIARIQDDYSSCRRGVASNHNRYEFINGSRTVMVDSSYIMGLEKPNMVIVDGADTFNDRSPVIQYLEYCLDTGVKVIVCGSMDIKQHLRFGNSIYSIKDHENMTFSLWPYYFNPTFDDDEWRSISLQVMGQESFDYSYGLLTKDLR